MPQAAAAGLTAMHDAPTPNLQPSAARLHPLASDQGLERFLPLLKKGPLERSYVAKYH